MAYSYFNWTIKHLDLGVKGTIAVFIEEESDGGLPGAQKVKLFELFIVAKSEGALREQIATIGFLASNKSHVCVCGVLSTRALLDVHV